MTVRHLIRFVLPFLTCLGGALPAQDPPPETPGVVHALVVPVRDVVGVRTVYMVQSALRAATAHGVRWVVLDIDTPGGMIVATKEIEAVLTELVSDRVRAIAFVRRRALSAGAHIALACSAIYMAPGAQIGAITPVMMGPGGIQQIADADVRHKLISALRGSVRALVERRKVLRPGTSKLAEAMVDPGMRVYEVTYKDEAGIETTAILDEDELRRRESRGEEIVSQTMFDTQPLTLTFTEALRVGLSSGTYSSVEEMMREEFGVTAAAIAHRDASWSEDAVAWLDGMKPVLFVIGFLLLLVELKAPGFAVPGVLGLVMLGLAMFGSYLVGLAEWTEILLFFAGIGLVAVEIFVAPGVVVFGLAGLACVIAGLVLSQQPFFLPANSVQEGMLLGNLLNILYLSISVIAGALLLSRVMPKIPVLNRIMQAPPTAPQTGASISYGGHRDAEGASASLVGRVGVAGTDLRPVGTMELDDRVFDVITDGSFVSRGTRIKILSIELNQVIVEPIDDAPSSESGEIALGLLILLWLLGLCFVIAEVFFVSFGILSILAALSFVSAIFLAYTYHGPVTGHVFLVTAAIGAPVAAYWALKWLPNSPIGRRLLLAGPQHDLVQGAAEQPGLSVYLNKAGVADSALRPAGIARIEGDRVDVVTRGEMIERGAAIRVVEVEANRVVVALDRRANTS